MVALCSQVETFTLSTNTYCAQSGISLAPVQAHKDAPIFDVMAVDSLAQRDTLSLRTLYDLHKRKVCNKDEHCSPKSRKLFNGKT